MNNLVSDEEVIAACKAGRFFVTDNSMKDVRRMLEGFLAGRPTPVLERVGYFYLGDDEWVQARDPMFAKTHMPLYRIKE